MAMPTARLVGTAVGILGAIGLLSAGNVLQARADSVPYLAEISAAYSDWHIRDQHHIPGNTQGTVLFFGDSHMQQYWPRLEWLASDPDAPRHSVLFRTRGGCAPIPGIERTGYGCAKFVDQTFELAHQPEIRTVVIGASWVGFTDRKDYFQADAAGGEPLEVLKPENQWIMNGFESAVSELVKAGKRVVIVLSSPYGKEFDPRGMAQRDGWSFRVQLPPAISRRDLDADSAFIDDRLIAIAQRTGASVLDPLDTICDAQTCPTLDTQGKPVLKDESHLRSSFVRLQFDAFDRFVRPPETAGNLNM